MTRGTVSLVTGIACVLAISAAGADAPEVPRGSGKIERFLGCELEDGRIEIAAITPEDMPWRVSIGMPRESPLRGSRQEAREAAIEAMRGWERAIRNELPWFALEFVKKDREAPVQIRWKRRMTGSAAGRAGPTCSRVDGRLRGGGRMEVAVRSCPTCTPVTIDQLRMLFAHEFGHVLGLGHCLDCDSAMNYSWETRERVFVTQTDVAAAVRRLSGADLTAVPSDPETGDAP